ncbi:DNA primase [Thermotoga caldifontis]|uniref:DNA primase n=1 Tax=Thermotoga caldifontis TaxID=1508419 RepID=UPI000596CC7F|nr:DNA primase [Thermotoga caldifontis]
MVNRDLIERIKKSVDIVELVSQYVSLQKVGSSYRGLCPFHTEKTPSFFVNPDLKLYHCFGCGAAGDAIKFLQEIEHISFQEALERLAKMAGIELKVSSGRSEKDVYVEYLTRVFTEYRKQLEQHRPVVEYLIRRGFSEEEVRSFEFGFSPQNSRIAQRVARAMSLPDEKALQYGLYRPSTGVDLFENRLILPIRDENGKIVALAGRSLDDREPKYMNSPETKFFSKKTVLFMLDKAKKAIKALDFAVICEGYFDALAFHRAGVTNAVAVLGTSLTREHITKLVPLTKNVILSFDNDDAGVKATLRSLKVLLEASFDVAILRLPEKDPDDVYKKYGPEFLKKLLSGSIPFEDYLVEVYEKFFNVSTSAGLEKYIGTLKIWAQILLRDRRMDRYEKLVEAVSKRTRLSTAQVGEMFRLQSKPVTPIVEATLPNEEDYIVYLYITHEELRNEIDEIDPQLLSERTKRLLSFLRENRDLSELDTDLREYAFRVLAKIPEGDPNKMLSDVKRRFARKAVERELSQIDSKLTSCQNDEERSLLLKKRLELVSQLRSLGGDRGGT